MLVFYVYLQVAFPEPGENKDIVSLRGPKEDVEKCANYLKKLGSELVKMVNAKLSIGDPLPFLIVNLVMVVSTHCAPIHSMLHEYADDPYLLMLLHSVISIILCPSPNTWLTC